MSVLPVSWLISNCGVDSIVINSSYDLPALLLLPSPNRPRQLCILLQFGVHSAKPAVLGFVWAWNWGSSNSESSGIKNVLVPSNGLATVIVFWLIKGHCVQVSTKPRCIIHSSLERSRQGLSILTLFRQRCTVENSIIIQYSLKPIKIMVPGSNICAYTQKTVGHGCLVNICHHVFTNVCDFWKLI